MPQIMEGHVRQVIVVQQSDPLVIENPVIHGNQDITINFIDQMLDIGWNLMCTIAVLILSNFFSAGLTIHIDNYFCDSKKISDSYKQSAYNL